jgi:hypothetical protein
MKLQAWFVAIATPHSTARRPMLHTISRALSLLVIAVALWFALPIERGGWYVLLILVPSLVFIWFPEEVDDFTFGTWRDGYQIDVHTPPVLIAIAGWVLLLVDAIFIVSPDFLARVFGVI